MFRSPARGTATNRIALILTVVLAVGLVTITPTEAPVRAQVPVLGVVLKGMVVKHLITKFEEAGSGLIKQAEVSGNVMLSKAGDELLLATQNLDFILDNHREKLFDDLTHQQQQAFIELNKLIEVADKAPDKIASITELSTLNFHYLSPNILGGKKDFYISSIKGLTQVFQENNYDLQIRGLGFGFDEGDTAFKVEFLCSGKELPATAIRREHNHELLVAMPHEILKPFFHESKVVHVPLILRSTVFKLGVKGKTYEAKFNLILLPLLAGEAVIEETVEAAPRLGDKVHTHTLTANVSEKINGHKPPFVVKQEWTCPPTAKIVGVRYECPPGNIGGGGIGGFTYNLRRIRGAKEYDPDYDILDDGSKVMVFRNCSLGGEHTTTVHHHIDYKFLEKQFVSSKRTIKLSFHDPLVLHLSPQNKRGTYTIIGKLVTGHKIMVTNETAPGSSGLLKLKGIGEDGDHLRAVFELSKP